MTRRGYAICTEPRSGSSFLGRILESTGALGRPKEYFSRARVRAEIWRDPRAGLTKLLERASSANGIYGLKMFSYHVDVLAGTGWQSRLPGLVYVHLERRDLLGRAISSVRAAQSGRAQSWQPKQGLERYDPDAIERQIRIGARDQARWRDYFARTGIEPLYLEYDQVAADPQAAADAVATFVGLDPAPSIDPARIDLAILRDEISAEWRRRFVAERGDVTKLAVGGLGWAVHGWLRYARARLDPFTVRRDNRDWP